MRLTVHAGGTAHDWQNEQTRRWLLRHLGDDGYCTMPAHSMSGEKVVHILLPTVYDAAALLLACPHLKLHMYVYQGPKR